jgi:hypothetical protein
MCSEWTRTSRTASRPGSTRRSATSANSGLRFLSAHDARLIRTPVLMPVMDLHSLLLCFYFSSHAFTSVLMLLFRFSCQALTGKNFDGDFHAALKDGVLLCEVLTLPFSSPIPHGSSSCFKSPHCCTLTCCPDLKLPVAFLSDLLGAECY